MAVAGFDFTLNAWRGLTHPQSSPAWNGHFDGVPDDATNDLGRLWPTETVEDGWRLTADQARAFEATVVVLHPAELRHDLYGFAMYVNARELRARLGR